MDYSFDRDLKSRAASVMNASPYRWRTVGSVAKELGEMSERVEEIFTKSGAFVRAKSPNKKGESLYSTTERYKRDTPLINRIFGAATNTVAE